MQPQSNLPLLWDTSLPPWDIRTRPIIPTIYSLYFPETHAVVDELWRERPHRLFEASYTKRQDPHHGAFLDTWLEWSGVRVPKNLFPHAYPCNGASEPIAHLTALQIATHGPNTRLHIFDGEYQGFAEVAKSFEMKGDRIVIHPRDVDHLDEPAFRMRAGDYVFVSDPASIDGEYWSSFSAFLDRLNGLYGTTVPVYLDVTYQGLVRNPRSQHPAEHANVRAVIFSLSKPFGVYYHRIGGIFSRDPMPSLWPNVWFKNVFSLELGRRLMKKHEVDDLPSRYKDIQMEAIAYGKEIGLLPDDTVPANVLLLAKSRTPPPLANPEWVSAYRRADGAYRYCLTPYLDFRVNRGWSMDEIRRGVKQ